MSSNADHPARWKTTKRASALRFQVLNAFVDTGMAELSRVELALWLVLHRDIMPGRTVRDSLRTTAIEVLSEVSKVGPVVETDESPHALFRGVGA